MHSLLTQPAHPGARARMVVSWAAAAVSWLWPPTVPQALNAVSWPSWPCRRRPTVPCRGHSGRVAIQPMPHAPLFWSQYNLCIAIQTQPSSHPSHNIIGVLQHTYPLANLHAYCNTNWLQYSSQPTTHLSCNTIPLLQYNH